MKTKLLLVRLKPTVLIWLMAILLVPSLALSSSPVRVVGVSDGDTIRVVGTDWRQDESAARAAKKGLWRDPTPTPPWEWRAQQRNSQQALHESAPTPRPPSSPAQEAGSVFSGNVKSGVFHRSSCKHFRCKNCTKTFHSRQAALDAGYRPCGNCKA